MTQQEKWRQQQMALLHTHHQEWKNYAAQKIQAREVLTKQYRDQKVGLHWGENILEWAAIVKHYSEGVLGLTTASNLEGEAMKKRQKQESLKLQGRFRQE